MTMIDVDTSPLQAAREWRGISLVAAARNSGLLVAQAEALEEGEPGVFDSIDEMIAAAVVYGASIGIGRDEAMALLDRTVCRIGAQVELPDIATEPSHGEDHDEANGFSQAVQARSARMLPTAAEQLVPVSAWHADLDDHHVLDPILDDEMSQAVELDEHGPTPEQAVQASGEIHIDPSFGPEAPWDRGASSFDAGSTGELEAWASEDFDRDGLGGGPDAAVRRSPHGGGIGAKMADTSQAALERLVGTDRSDAFVAWTRRSTDRVQDVTRGGRERLRRSEHATLILAIGGGAVLIASLVAIGGALGGAGDTSGPGPAKREVTLTTPGEQGVPAQEASPEKVEPVAAAAAQAAPKASVKAKPTPVVAPSRLTVDIFNDGRRKGYAKEVAARLEQAGYGVGEVTNARGDYAAATVIHPKGMEREARALGKQLGITNLQAMTNTSSRFTVIVK